MSEQLLLQILDKLDRMETEQNHFREDTTNRLDRLETDQKNFKEEALDALNRIAEEQKNDVISLLEKINNSTTEIKSEINQLKIVQSRQHDIIQLLSARSIQHESIISKLSESHSV